MKTIALMSNEPSWTYNLRKEIIQELIDEDYKVVLVLPYGEKVELLKNMGCEFVDVPMFERRGKKPITEIRLLLYYKKVLRNVKPDVVLTYTIKPNLYGGFICGLLHIPFLANITGLGTAVDSKGMFSSLTKLLYKIGLKYVSQVFVQNDSSFSYLRGNDIVPLHKITRIYGSGVNLKDFIVSKYPTDEVIKFVFVSRILEAKGIEEYLNAAVKVKKTYDNVEFHVCGLKENDYKGTLDEKQANGIVIYHGMVDNMENFLKEMHCLVHPSYYLEGLSNVCLEAAASGRPVITTDHEGCRETVINGKTGYIIPIKDSKALANAMIEFIKLSNSEKREMGLSGRKYVESKYDRQIIVKAYLTEIKEILK